jgi:hypothetical protein
LTWVILGIAALAVVAVGVVTIGAVVGRLAVAPPTSVFDEDEAVEWIADRLPVEVASQVSHDDVRLLVTWHLDFLVDEGIATESAYADAPDDVLVGENDGLAYVIGQAADAGLELDDAHVAIVLDTERDYLEAIGAIGPRVSEQAEPAGRAHPVDERSVNGLQSEVDGSILGSPRKGGGPTE